MLSLEKCRQNLNDYTSEEPKIMYIRNLLYKTIEAILEEVEQDAEEKSHNIP